MASSGEFVLAPEDRPVLSVAGTDQVFPVRRIYCVGKNYVAHIREMNADERDPPVLFQKPADSIVRDGGEIPYPVFTNHVYGYAIGLDMTRRDHQAKVLEKGMPWEVTKAFDRSCPVSAIHPVGEVGHLDSGNIRLTVNGEVRQDADLSLMIWKTPEIISKLSEQFELKAGDIILTGTPAGVGSVTTGDELVGTVDRLGSLTVRIGPKIADYKAA